MTIYNNHKRSNSFADISKGQPESFWLNRAVRSDRRGHFWIPGERVKIDGQTLQRGPMFVEWQAPEQVTQPYPIVLVHGGLLQGTEWLDTPDGRPGWAQRLAEAGYAVLVVDRPGHGRSHTHPDVIGPVGHAFSYEEGEHVFFPPEDADRQTQWPFDVEDTDALDSFIAAFGPLPADFCESQEIDAERLSRLLDKIGPAILMTHSASGPLGWLVADQRPGQLVAIVSVEPMGPAFVTAPGIGTLKWGLTAAPVNYDPPHASAEDVQAADPLLLQIPAMKGLPIAVVTGEVSVFATHGPAIVHFLNTAGATAEQLHLPDYGILGNGHGLIYEKNSDEAIKPVLDWLARVTVSTPGKKTEQTLENIAEESDKITLYISYEGDSTAPFNNDYYMNVHCPLVRQAWDAYGLESARVYFPADKEDGTILIWAGVFKDRSSLDAAFKAPLTPKVMEDVKNFTDLTPRRNIAEAFKS
jgi:pimeloyl-ACP methyl ester carboxylesterase